MQKYSWRCCLMIIGMILFVDAKIASAVCYYQSSGELDRATIQTNCTELKAVKIPDFMTLTREDANTYILQANKLVFNFWVSLDCDGQKIRYRYTTVYGGNNVSSFNLRSGTGNVWAMPDNFESSGLMIQEESLLMGKNGLNRFDLRDGKMSVFSKETAVINSFLLTHPLP